MGIIIGGTPPQDLILDGQSVSLYAGGSPPTKVWPTGPETVQITLGTLNEAQSQFRAALSDRGLDYRTVTEIPFEIELVGSGSTRSMFNGCSDLASVPAMDTSQVTSMSYMFQNCASLTSAPVMDTSQVTSMSYMFQNCASLTSAPVMDTRSVMYMNSMFRGCASLTHVPDMDTSQVTTMANMFQGCAALTSAPPMDTGQVTTMANMFEDCSSLTHVPDMETSNVTDMRYMFRYCSSLTDGNVRLIGRHPQVSTAYMIAVSGLTRLPFYNAAGNPI